VQLAAALGENLYRQAIADSLKQGAASVDDATPYLPDAVRFGGEHRIFARMHANVVQHYRRQSVAAL
ncbi:MAG TPA: hypothetical protein VJ302_32800, partial [Blastocatellia bacterium]|nr:hypothetical protein [Blastocatellia bacterium]